MILNFVLNLPPSIFTQKPKPQQQQTSPSSSSFFARQISFFFFYNFFQNFLIYKLFIIFVFKNTYGNVYTSTHFFWFSKIHFYFSHGMEGKEFQIDFDDFCGTETKTSDTMLFLVDSIFLKFQFGCCFFLAFQLFGLLKPCDCATKNTHLLLFLSFQLFFFFRELLHQLHWFFGSFVLWLCSEELGTSESPNQKEQTLLEGNNKG